MSWRRMASQRLTSRTRSRLVPEEPTGRHRRRPGGMVRPAASAAGLALVAGVVLGACGGSGTDPDPAGPGGSGIAEPSPTTTARAPEDGVLRDGSLAAAIRALPPAPGSPVEAPALPAPVALGIPALDVVGAPLVPVGVKPDGEMEIPGATEVGWYRHGARPGDSGTAVLAAHIAYAGVDGVFRHLEDLRAGDEVVVGFADGTTLRFTVEAVTRYPKSELPDDLFTGRGDAQLALITCGGRFDAANGRYEDNVVAHARPA
jgi:LPXTG-site transpeptidase (sortase) family protein